jgi:hypothetical protein
MREDEDVPGLVVNREWRGAIEPVLALIWVDMG